MLTGDRSAAGVADPSRLGRLLLPSALLLPVLWVYAQFDGTPHFALHTLTGWVVALLLLLWLTLDGVPEAAQREAPLLLTGHSLGAILALAWAARRPDWFDGLLLLGLPCYRSPQEARRHVAGLGPLAYDTVATPRISAAICALMCFARPLWRAVVPHLMPNLPREVAKDSVLHTWRSYSGTLTHCILDADTGAIAQRVAASTLPVRLLQGDRDREAPPEAVAALAEQAGWQLQLLPGADHGLPIEQPRQCAEAIRGLLGQVAERGR